MNSLQITFYGRLVYGKGAINQILFQHDKYQDYYHIPDLPLSIIEFTTNNTLIQLQCNYSYTVKDIFCLTFTYFTGNQYTVISMDKDI